MDRVIGSLVVHRSDAHWLVRLMEQIEHLTIQILGQLLWLSLILVDHRLELVRAKMMMTKMVAAKMMMAKMVAAMFQNDCNMAEVEVVDGKMLVFGLENR